MNWSAELLSILLLLMGFLAGLIDAIAGGGGLITLPTTALAVGPGVVAVATNKIVGLSAASVSFLVYLRHGYNTTPGGWTFALWVGTGSFVGSRLAPLISPEFFSILLIVTCPLILVVIWRRDFWIQNFGKESSRVADQVASSFSFVASGILCGLYDGIWGPGGGTFMLLSLLIFVKLPLFPALAISKLANATSAGVALISYAQSGHVVWDSGILMAISVALGSYVGAEFVSRQASKVFRPLLTIVVLILLAKLLWGP